MKLYTFLLPVLIVLLFLFASLRVDYTTQTYLSILFIALLLFLRRYKSSELVRVLFLTLSSYVVIRYFFWRIFSSLAYEDFFSFVGASLLFTAELYGGFMFFFSAFVNVRPFNRQPIELPTDKSLWPSVDIVIPSYDEPVDLVKITLAAATNISYPSDKVKVYLLDDGGTQQKLNDKNESVRNAAIERRKQFKAICSELNVHYLARKENINAKAGNLNAALQYLSGDLILVLDADHAPSVDILEKTAGSFVADEKVFLVQTPHFFINPDPIEKNLNLFYRMPSENYMFYRAIQQGLDFWQSSFFCGSAAVLRRKAIDEVEGFSGKTITEDSETALKLHSKGWKSHYIMIPLISGLQPETFASFMIQRMRWAQGMVQNFILHNPLIMPNLRFWQRICYLSNMMFWFFPYARFIFLVSPGLYLFFGLKIYNANIFEFFNYTLPYLITLLLTNHYLFSKVRWVFVSEIYETMQSLFSMRAVSSVLRNPHKPKFSVTPKMETMDDDFISPLAIPFYWTIVITLLAACFGVWKLFIFPEERSLISITVFWALFNLMLLLAALGALYEHRQRRHNPRIPVRLQGSWVVKSKNTLESTRIPITIRDISMGGGNLVATSPLISDDSHYLAFLEVKDEMTGQSEFYRSMITNTIARDRHYVYGIKFIPQNTEEYLRIVRFIHGDSSRWIQIQQDIASNPGLIKSMAFMIRIGVVNGLSHIRIALLSALKKMITVYD